MASVEDLVFEGKAGEIVTAFLQKVKRVAFSQGRQRDDEWQVDYLKTCLSGAALVWYDGLEEKARGDYKSLRSAMLQRFDTTEMRGQFREAHCPSRTSLQSVPSYQRTSTPCLSVVGDNFGRDLFPQIPTF